MALFFPPDSNKMRLRRVEELFHLLLWNGILGAVACGHHMNRMQTPEHRQGPWQEHNFHNLLERVLTFFISVFQHMLPRDGI